MLLGFVCISVVSLLGKVEKLVFRELEEEGIYKALEKDTRDI